MTSIRKESGKVIKIGNEKFKIELTESMREEKITYEGIHPNYESDVKLEDHANSSNQ